MSDTPRTDECTYPADCLGKTLVVNADLAKSLERELKEKWEALFDLAKDMGKLQIELEQANRRLASEYASSGWDDYSSIKLLQRENAALRVTLEQCEEALELAFIGGSLSATVSEKVAAALASVRKEAQP